MQVAFDFDKTLTQSDTLFGFFAYSSKKDTWFYLSSLVYFFAAFLYKVRIINNFKLKNFGVYLFIKGMRKDDYKKNCLQYAHKIKLTSLIAKLEGYVKEGHEVYIISGSLKDYVQATFSNLDVTVIGSTLSFKKGKINNLSFNCFGKNKVEALKKVNVFELDIFFTDSFLDLSLMNIANMSNLVKQKKENIVLREIRK